VSWWRPWYADPTAVTIACFLFEWNFLKKAAMALAEKLGEAWSPSQSHQTTGEPLVHPWYSTQGLGSMGLVWVPQLFCLRIHRVPLHVAQGVRGLAGCTEPTATKVR
jgi:hypothetical protein